MKEVLNLQELNLDQRKELNITSIREIPFHLKKTTLEKEDILKQLTYITLLLYEKGYSLFAIDPSDFVEVDRTLSRVPGRPPFYTSFP